MLFLFHIYSITILFNSEYKTFREAKNLSIRLYEVCVCNVHAILYQTKKYLCQFRKIMRVWHLQWT
jgi:hypothetical protein